VHTLVTVLKDQLRHEFRSESDYISGPKDDGYRSHHLIFNFHGRDANSRLYNGRRIELQVRTRLQHSWATAIEAVGLFRGEALKNHQGSQDWLRLFMLMSAEFAEAERCPIPSSCPDKDERRREIRNLAGSLDALSIFDRVSHGVLGTGVPLAPNYRPTHVRGAKLWAGSHFFLAPIRRHGFFALCAAAAHPFRAEPSRA
jgi:hypothetical protein